MSKALALSLLIIGLVLVGTLPAFASRLPGPLCDGSYIEPSGFGTFIEPGGQDYGPYIEPSGYGPYIEPNGQPYGPYIEPGGVAHGPYIEPNGCHTTEPGNLN